MIHINTKVSVVDFGILEPKTYTFFVNNELLSLKIGKSGKDYSYDLQIDRKSPTPLNIAREKLAKKIKRQSVAFYCSFFLLLGLAIYFFKTGL